MARQVNLTVDQGSYWTQNVTAYINASSTATVNLYNFANGSSQMRKTYSSASQTANITVDIHPGGSANAGTITLSMNNITTGAITDGRYVYDVEIRGNEAVNDGGGKPHWSDGSEDGKVYRAVEGILTIKPQVTKWDW